MNTCEECPKSAPKAAELANGKFPTLTHRGEATHVGRWQWPLTAGDV
jgi:hypothetical protein